ncbi:MAG: YciI family protein [Gammaproteobacteria bacterium]|nr:YciI family protein [Gammaproteobacteria bacterium]
MFLLVVNYTQSTEEVSKHVASHSEWVKKYIDEGIFVFAGPKKNKLGGAILAKSIDRIVLDKILAEDSFVKVEVAIYQVIDFDCRVTVPDLELLKTA